jgi:hypothetical protein
MERGGEVGGRGGRGGGWGEELISLSTRVSLVLAVIRPWPPRK